MTVSFNSINKEFYELRDMILNDLNFLLGLPKGGNYIAALLISTACEALGRLRYESGEGSEFFRDYLLPKSWRSVSSTIFDALRNGLAHSFATKSILQIPGAPLELGISWGDKPHLVFDAKQGCLYLNIKDLSDALREAFSEYEKDLRNDDRLCELFRKRRKRKLTVDVQNGAEQEAWKELISQLQILQLLHP